MLKPTSIEKKPQSAFMNGTQIKWFEPISHAVFPSVE